MSENWTFFGVCRLVLLVVLNVNAALTCLPAATSRRVSNIRGTDCSQIKKVHPGALSGLYMIQPVGVGKAFRAYCEMRPDGGWTVFQRRTGGAVSFARTWAAYKNGFGEHHGDHWLGLHKLRAITRGKGTRWVLRVDLCDFEGGVAFAQYNDFKLGNENQAYRLTVGAYSGTAGDAIRGIDPVHGAIRGYDQTGYGFSTKDRDNDGCSPCIFGDIAVDNCSQDKGNGGWWYSRCGLARLHGDWHSGDDNKGWASGLHWLTWKGPAPYSARATRMMVKAL